MMTLGQKQRRFTIMVAILIIYAYFKGYEMSLGDAWAKSGHREGSFHYKRLAIDLNLFKNGVWLSKTSDHKSLGEFWEMIGGTWGGRFRNKDGNHYSYGEK